MKARRVPIDWRVTRIVQLYNYKGKSDLKICRNKIPRTFKIYQEWIWGSYQKIQNQLYFFRWEASTPNILTIGLTNQYTKLNRYQAITLANITILVQTETFFYQSKNGFKNRILNIVYGIKCQQSEQTCMKNLGSIRK